MFLYHKAFLVFLLIFCFLPSFADAQGVPSGVAIDLYKILDISENIGGFLFVLGGVLAGITLIASAIMYFLSGGDSSKVKTAKDILKAGIIGAFILFGSGVIVNMIKTFATNPLDFFK